MVYVAHRRLTFLGEFQSFTDPAYEKWSFRLNLGVGETTANLQTMADEGLAAYGLHLKSLFPSHVKLTEVKAASINTFGQYDADPASAFAETPGTGPAVNLPTQTAVVVSLLSDTRGPSGKGRIYLPTPSFIPLAGDGRITAGNAATIANAAAAFLSAINGPAGFGNVIIASTKGTSAVVNEVKVGRVLDTIRSRRTSIVEDYTAPVLVGS